jgi:hypothetical protein
MYDFIPLLHDRRFIWIYDKDYWCLHIADTTHDACLRDLRWLLLLLLLISLQGRWRLGWIMAVVFLFCAVMFESSQHSFMIGRICMTALLGTTLTHFALA